MVTTSLSIIFAISRCIVAFFMPSVLWHCWFGDRKGIRHVKQKMCCCVGGDLTGALHDFELIKHYINPPLLT